MITWNVLKKTERISFWSDGQRIIGIPDRVRILQIHIDLGAVSASAQPHGNDHGISY